MRPEEVTDRAGPSQAAIQSALLALITGRGSPPTAPDPDTLVVGDGRASALERLEVYRHMYRARIVEALESQFPRVARALGAQGFAEMAGAYIGDEPSRHPSLRFVGERLPGWLELRRAETPMLGALARLEWARTDLFDQADETVLTLDAIRVLPADRFAELPLALVRAHRVLTFPAGTGDLWDALGPEATLGPPTIAGPWDARPSSDAVESVVVWRQETAVYHRVLDGTERLALEHVGAGARFGSICDALLAERGEEGAIARAYTLLLTWLADGLVRAVDAPVRRLRSRDTSRSSETGPAPARASHRKKTR